MNDSSSMDTTNMDVVCDIAKLMKLDFGTIRLGESHVAIPSPYSLSNPQIKTMLQQKKCITSMLHERRCFDALFGIGIDA